MNMGKERAPVYIGCAGWSIPSSYSEHFSTLGSHLERYATRFSCVEINSSFYRSHRLATYTKWAASTPELFRFSVKVPKLITHQHRLKDADEALRQFLSEVAELGQKLGPLLVQLPPSLGYAKDVASDFFSSLRDNFEGEVVCEPRHLSWFADEANRLLASYKVARVAANPALLPEGGAPGGWSGLAYYRLHGSPQIYRSAYEHEYLSALAERIQSHFEPSTSVWCIFDNTAEGAATGNALKIQQILSL